MWQRKVVLGESLIVCSSLYMYWKELHTVGGIMNVFLSIFNTTNDTSWVIISSLDPSSCDFGILSFLGSHFPYL